jgi:hypothetical protein
MTVTAGTAHATTASSPCARVASTDNSNAVVETTRTGATAHLEPAAECAGESSIGPLVKLNAWCGVYNYYGNWWVSVGQDRWIYSGDLVLVSGTVNHC